LLGGNALFHTLLKSIRVDRSGIAALFNRKGWAMTRRWTFRVAATALVIILLFSLNVASPILSVFAAPDPLTIELSIDEVSFSSASNTISVIGTVNCSEHAPFALLTVVAVQRDGLSLDRDATMNVILSGCHGDTPFNITFAAANGAFHTGPAVVTAMAAGCDRIIPRPGSAVCATDRAIRVVLLAP
jgi:hypothetical protein